MSIKKAFFILLSISITCALHAQIAVWQDDEGTLISSDPNVVASPNINLFGDGGFCGPCFAFCNSGPGDGFGLSFTDNAFNTPVAPGITNTPYAEITVTPNPGYEIHLTEIEMWIWSYNQGAAKALIGISTDGINWTTEEYDVTVDFNDCQSSHTPSNAGPYTATLDIFTTDPLYFRVQPFDGISVSDNGFRESDIFKLSLLGEVCVGDLGTFNDLEQQAVVLCEGSDLQLDAGGNTDLLTYSWTPAAEVSDPTASNPIISPGTTTLFQVEVFDNCGLVHTDSVLIEVNEGIMVDIEEPAGGPFCVGDTILLSGNVDNSEAELLWSTGDTTLDIFVTETGTYELQATLNVCTAADQVSIELSSLPNLSIENLSSESVCEGDSVILSGNVDDPETELLWSTGDTTVETTVTETGVYTLQATLNGCTETSDWEVILSPPPVISLELDYLICNGDTLILDLSDVGASIVWSDGQNASKGFFEEAGDYFVQANNGGCITTENFTLDVESCTCQFRVPNIFTPNGDGLNDVFEPVHDCEPGQITSYSLKIFNRWGELLFESTDVTQGWDAQEEWPADAYIYLLNAELLQDGETEIVNMQSDFILMR